uniref:Uncharacterized protein n=1 Tax=Oryza punctata TaxID=4537 RepID=A0A0E0LIA4_ORYPU
MESSASLPEYVQFDGDLLPVAWLEGEALAEFLVFLEDAAAASEDEAEPYEVEFEEMEEEPQEVEFAADDGSDDDDLVDDGGVMEDGVDDYVYDDDDDVELVDADFEDGGGFDDLVSDADLADDDGGATTPVAEEHAARVAEPPAATARNARMSVRAVNQFGVDYEAINEMIREYLQAKKKRRRARRVAAAMLRLQRQRRRRPAEDGGAPTWP